MSSGMNGTKSRGVFASVSEMQSADLRVGTTVWVHGGSRYDIYATNQGASLQLDNGLWADEVSGPTSTGEVNTASNVGTGVGVFAQKSGVDLQFKSIKASGGASVTADGDSITLDTSSLIGVAEKGVANGIATLQGDGKVPASQLPSYVDDVLEFPSFSDFPSNGESGKIYVAADTNSQYRWTGSVYVEFGSGSTTWGSITGTLANQTDLQNALNTKQAVLESGTNIKTVGGQSLLGAGDIPISSGGVNPQVATFKQIAAIPNGISGLAIVPFYDDTFFEFLSDTQDISKTGSSIVLNPGSYHINCIAHASKGTGTTIGGTLSVKNASADGTLDVVLDSVYSTFTQLFQRRFNGSDIIKITNQMEINIFLNLDVNQLLSINPQPYTELFYLRITKL